MASAFDSIERMPVWQRLVAWLVIAAAIGAVWYFLFYVDAVDVRDGAEQGLAKAAAELDRLEKKKANFLEEQRQHEEREAKFRETMEVLPMNASTVDNLMATFQQKARQVGLSFDRWENGTEQRQEFYARLPIKVESSGTWAQAGEFFRQVSELRQIVSVENISLLGTDRRDADEEHPGLQVVFEAATYRFLSEEERSSAATSAAPSRRERKGAGK
ncbi:MAG: type 4a pilus biogenesis protein PilO [Myxococcales bacterium]|nr:type 4a pilus biogenesis protein PilO [Myxococcales bacterium]